MKNKILNEIYWSSIYESGNMGWDIGVVSPPIKKYIDQIKDKSLKILIPGCGNAYEAEHLSSLGFTDITLLDVSVVITEELKKKFSENNNVKVVCRDFFKFEGKFDLIIEQTFFCALLPEMREGYLKKMATLLNSTGKIIGVLFDREFEKEGPPFGGSKEEYKTLFGNYFEIAVMEECFNSIPQRSGNEVFINLKQKTI